MARGAFIVYDHVVVCLSAKKRKLATQWQGAPSQLSLQGNQPPPCMARAQWLDPSRGIVECGQGRRRHGTQAQGERLPGRQRLGTRDVAHERHQGQHPP